MNKPKYYQPYHRHTSLSHRYNKDSPVTYMHYLKESDKLACKGIPQIACTMEHGWQGNYWKMYDDLENRNNQRMSDVKKKPKELEYIEGYQPIKFIFGTEAYWVEDRLSNDSSNNHLILLAKNDNGRRKINRAIYESFKTGYYYKNRMDLDILLSLPKDDVFVTSACFEGGTRVQTKDGFKSIEDVRTGDLVLTHNGTWEKVITPTKRHYKGKMRKLNIMGCFEDIKCTEDHKFPTVTKLHKGFTKEIVWKKAKDLIETDRILETMEDKKYREKGIEFIDVEEVIGDYREERRIKKRKNKSPILKDKIPIDDLFLTVLGLYVAEGNSNEDSNYLCFTLNKNETNLFDIINKFSNVYLKKSATIQDKKGTQGMSVLIHSKEMTLLFKHFINEGVYNKNTPNFVFEQPIEKQFSFLKGLFLGDGSVANTTRINFATTSKQLAYEIQSILENGGVKCSCYVNEEKIDKNEVNHKRAYIIEINSRKMAEYWRMFENSTDYYSFKPEEENYEIRRPININGVNYLCKKVKSNIEYEYDDMVYCLNVNNYHSFKVEGITVHNCIAYWGKYANVYDGEPNWDRIDEITLKLFNHFTDFYLEVQANNTDKQKIINKHIMELHYKYGIPIISATDSHYINPSQHEDREDLLKSNKISYPEEEGWFMDLPDLDTLIQRFIEQGVMTLEEIYEAIENTNKILDFEDIILDRSLKVPTPKKYEHLTQDEKNEIFVNILREEWRNQYSDVNIDKLDEYQKEIKHDISEILGCGMTDYFLANYEIMNIGQEKYGGILTPSGRGCFTEEALVHTRNDIKSIKDVEIGDYVVTKDGEFNKVLDKMSYDIEEPLVKIQHLYGTNTSNPTICTLDHKILTKEGWKCAKDLTKSDFVCVPKIKNSILDKIIIDLNDYNVFGYEYDNEYIYEIMKTYPNGWEYSPSELERKGIATSWEAKKFSDSNYEPTTIKMVKAFENILKSIPFDNRQEYINYTIKIRTKKINRYLVLDETVNEFIGLMYGDGFTAIRGRCIGLAINETSKQIVNRTCFYSFADKIGITNHCYENKSKTKNLTQLYINSNIIYNFICNFLFESKKGKEKIFNEILFNQPKECLYGIVKGLRESDGNIGKDGRVSFDNNSTSLINAYKLLCLMTDNGVNSLIVRNPYTTKEGYECNKSYKLRVGLTKLNEDNDYYYLPVTKIEILPKQKTTVYDITVENEHNYLLNNMIVHNSAVSMYLNKLLKFTKVDKINSPVLMYSERFLTKERILDSHTAPDWNNFIVGLLFLLKRRRNEGNEKQVLCI